MIITQAGGPRSHAMIATVVIAQKRTGSNPGRVGVNEGNGGGVIDHSASSVARHELGGARGPRGESDNL